MWTYFGNRPVQGVIRQAGIQLGAPGNRKAEDGTLWVEQPIYAQVMYGLDRVPAVVAAKPELKNVEPFKTVMSGDRAAIAKLTLPDLEKILAATLTGMSTDQFQTEIKQWIATAKDPRWKRAYTGSTYQPMQDVLKYLRANASHVMEPPVVQLLTCSTARTAAMTAASGLSTAAALSAAPNLASSQPTMTASLMCVTGFSPSGPATVS